eukprot:1801107-Ditylum_brightwellii.AAC.2
MHKSKTTQDHADRFNINLSVGTLFNGLLSIDLPTDGAFKTAHKNNKECQWLIKLANDPLQKARRYLNKVHYSFIPPLREGRMRQENNKLFLLEPTAN